MLKGGNYKNILVVGVDIYSNLIDKNDRTTAILFGDGAGAVVLTSETTTDNVQRGIIASELAADGSHTSLLCVPNGSANLPTSDTIRAGEHFLKMEGKEVFKHAVRSLTEIKQSILKKANIEITDVDHIISHQANQRILHAVAKQLNVAPEKVLLNVQKYGNTSAASVPILLADTIESGKISAGDVVLFSAFGGGFTWGAILVRW